MAEKYPIITITLMGLDHKVSLKNMDVPIMRSGLNRALRSAEQQVKQASAKHAYDLQRWVESEAKVDNAPRNVAQEILDKAKRGKKDD